MSDGYTDLLLRSQLKPLSRSACDIVIPPAMQASSSLRNNKLKKLNLITVLPFDETHHIISALLYNISARLD
jgi:hypothetical protein